MAQLTYRGNLSSKVFPFLSTQFGRTVISAGVDHVTAFGDAGGDNNIPQAYYMHNVVPTAQGYKSVGFKSILYPAGILFAQVIPTRDPDMTRGWIGITSNGQVYMYRAGDRFWTNVTPQVAGWTGGSVSIAYAGGYTYLCLPNFGVYKLNVGANSLTPVDFKGIIENGIVAITSKANYLIITDGVTIYWSSTVDPEDFEPSLITGAGSGKIADAEGLIVALMPLGSGFAVYTAVNVVVAAYSQNSRFPWIFNKAENSKGIASIQHIASGDDNYVWASAGLQKISPTGAVTVLAEATDFLAGQEFEDYDSVTNTLSSQYLLAPMQVKLAFIGARYLIVSYGMTSLTHALVYDTALKRWGKLKFNHVACFEVTINTDGQFTTNVSASAKKTLGLMTAAGEVFLCDLSNNADATDSVMLFGKYQVIRSRMTTVDKVMVESVEADAAFEVLLDTTMDGKTLLTPLKLNEATVASKFREYMSRVTGVNHSVILKGKFNLNSFEIVMHLNGRR